MTPHPDELATLLALPPAAREALARCEGPGWACKAGREPLIMAMWGMSLPKPEEWAWLPASEAAILALVPDAPALDRSERGDWRAWSEGLTSGWCATARLAALRLLAEVS